jgi:hypothetical protein
MKTQLLLICFVLLYFHSMACSCIGESSVETDYRRADLVVTGIVINVQTIKIWDDTTFAVWNYKPEADSLSLEQYKFNESLYGIHLLEYTFVVETSYKGASINDTIKIWTGFGHGDCGFPFIIGKKYLIYAEDEYKVIYSQKKLGRSKKELESIFRTDICRRTALLEESLEDIKYLNGK